MERVKRAGYQEGWEEMRRQEGVNEKEKNKEERDEQEDRVGGEEERRRDSVGGARLRDLRGVGNGWRHEDKLGEESEEGKKIGGDGTKMGYEAKFLADQGTGSCFGKR
jgi:hypothetical protein